MADQIKFTAEELEELKTLQSEYQKVIYNLGQIQIEKRLLESKEKEINSLYESLNQQEKSILEQLNQKYGAGALDLESGTFTPNS